MMGKNIFITRASSGIGKAIAEYLTENGHNVIGTSRKNDSKNSKFEIIPLDVTDEQSIHTAFLSAIEKFPKLTVYFLEKIFVPIISNFICHNF